MRWWRSALAQVVLGSFLIEAMDLIEVAGFEAGDKIVEEGEQIDRRLIRERRWRDAQRTGAMSHRGRSRQRLTAARRGAGLAGWAKISRYSFSSRTGSSRWVATASSSAASVVRMR